MSYEIATSITIVGDKIKVTSHSNNVFPKYDTHWELPNTDDGLRDLLRLIDEGSVQPIPSANDYKWSGIDCEISGLTGEERFETFKRLARQKTKGWYIIQFENGSYLAKHDLYSGYIAVKLQPYALRMRKAKANHIAKRFKHLNPVVLEDKPISEEPLVVSAPVHHT